MVVDTSALIAILFGGTGRRNLSTRALASAGAGVSAGTVLETQIISRRRYNVASDKALDGLLYRMNLHVEPVTLDQLELARAGYRRFGQGTGGGALNFGDCFSYALAKARNQPLLFKGADFARTDIQVAAWALPAN